MTFLWPALLALLAVLPVLVLLRLRALRRPRTGVRFSSLSLVRTAVPVILRSPLLPLVQRRLFIGAPLPPIDPAFSFRGPAGAPTTHQTRAAS